MRRSFLALALSTALLCSCRDAVDSRVPVVLISDLYYPGQDVGDNFDLLTPFALDCIDLQGVVFDVTEHFRDYHEDNGVRRDPGFIPVTQLNYLFDKDVPCGCGPFDPLSYPEDTKEDAPDFQQKGIELLLSVLEKADRPVHIVSTGSLRPLAVAYNRRPDLLCSDKVAAVHICAGASSDTFLEWNIALDTLAAARVLRSPMRMNIYPCATEDGPFDKGVNNTFWALRDLDWILDMEDHRLCNYLVYNLLSVSDHPDYLGYLERPLPLEHVDGLKARSEDLFYGSGGRHYVWETAVWQQVAGLMLVEHSDGCPAFVKDESVADTDRIVVEQMWPVSLAVQDNGLFTYKRLSEDSRVNLYFRQNPLLQEKLLNKCLPALYNSYRSVVK